MNVPDVRTGSLKWLVIFLVAFSGLVAPVRAQPSQRLPSSASPADAGADSFASGGTGGTSGVTGGGGGADFTALMTLIQQTIDPDAWIDNSSVMAPFPSGVYIDPLGQLTHRTTVAATPLALGAGVDAIRHPWRTSSPLRIVSLRQLNQTLGELAAAGLRASQEHAHLAGLSRIEYVRVDVATEDVWLAGPAAGGRAEALQGFQLADLGLLIDLINSRSTPLGCSIDPTDEGILAAQQLLTPVGALKRLAIDPQKFVVQMQDKIGPHHVRVFGMPAGSPAAVALVAADEHMKQLGFGTSRTVVDINSYFDYLDQQADVPAQSLIRWWFTYANEPIRANLNENTFQLPQQCVTLLSEQQWVSLLGRKSTGQNDAAADAFAAGLTARLGELREEHPAYARMCAVFETTLALQLAVEASGQHSLQAWFPKLKQLGQFAYGPLPAPKTVSGLTTWHRLKQGTVVAVVSGGVQINARPLAARARWQADTVAVDLPLKSLSVDPSRGYWWWD